MEAARPSSGSGVILSSSGRAWAGFTLRPLPSIMSNKEVTQNSADGDPLPSSPCGLLSFIFDLESLLPHTCFQSGDP